MSAVLYDEAKEAPLVLFRGSGMCDEAKEAPLVLFGGNGKPICAVVVVGVGGMLGEAVEVLELARGGKTEYEYLGDGVREEFDSVVVGVLVSVGAVFDEPQSTSRGEGGAAEPSTSLCEEGIECW